LHVRDDSVGRVQKRPPQPIALLALLAIGCGRSSIDDDVIASSGPLSDTGAVGPRPDATDADLSVISRESAIGDPESAVDAAENVATTQIAIAANVSSMSTPPPSPWLVQMPAETSNFSTQIFVYDAVGATRSIVVYFRVRATDQWEFHILANAPDVESPSVGPYVDFGNGTLSFAPDGSVADSSFEGGSIRFTGAPQQTIVLDTLGPPPGAESWAGLAACPNPSTDGPYPPSDAESSCLGWITQTPWPSAVFAQAQDGHASPDP
jgi:hypothetical protein